MDKADRLNVAYMFLHRQLTIEDHTEVANRVGWLHNDRVEVEDRGLKLFELE